MFYYFCDIMVLHLEERKRRVFLDSNYRVYVCIKNKANDLYMVLLTYFNSGEYLSLVVILAVFLVSFICEEGLSF